MFAFHTAHEAASGAMGTAFRNAALSEGRSPAAPAWHGTGVIGTVRQWLLRGQCIVQSAVGTGTTA